jgi:hypothetical protein
MPGKSDTESRMRKPTTKFILGGRRLLSLAPATWGGHGSASLARSNLERRAATDARLHC